MAQAGFILQGAQGKLANIVARKKVGGGTVLAEYKRNISNPNTAAQQGVRSSFKLISQLASQLAEIIAIPREGAKSSRNLFTSINYPKVFANEAGSGVILQDIQLTKSNIPLPAVGIYDRTDGTLGVTLRERANLLVDKVVYIVLKNNNGNLTKIDEAIVETPGSNGKFSTEFSTQGVNYSGNLVVYAYGIKFENEAARVKYANMGISTADEVAQVVINRTFSTAEANVTSTTGVQLEEEESDDGSSNSKPYRLTLNKGGLKGTVSGEGFYGAGETVTLQFTPADSKQHFTAFAEEDENGNYTPISNNNPATFTMPARDVNVVVRGYTTNS